MCRFAVAFFLLSTGVIQIVSVCVCAKSTKNSAHADLNAEWQFCSFLRCIAYGNEVAIQAQTQDDQESGREQEQKLTEVTVRRRRRRKKQWNVIVYRLCAFVADVRFVWVFFHLRLLLRSLYYYLMGVCRFCRISSRWQSKQDHLQRKCWRLNIFVCDAAVAWKRQHFFLSRSSTASPFKAIKWSL